MELAAVIISGIMLKKDENVFAGDPRRLLWSFRHITGRQQEMYYVPVGAGKFIYQKAGTIILLSSILIWAGSFSDLWTVHLSFDPDMELESSILGIIGGQSAGFLHRLIWKYQAAIATIMGLVAKEEVAGVFGVLGL